ncbi:VOC family protein [Tumebacillus sp. DT12]|uniref:VOC family protein n=1 Tax=Tumebacillus lacus TaxID=2995335 RepID=A0ABT3X112_9BACL|nr:VOC family protein [Tumebacillus lacus]MCX7569245.1 VOC family protein [Tumebacillus lacus]
MISKLGQVMLYVNNQDAAVKFWTEKVGFRVISEEKNDHMRWIEIAPEGAETSLILHDKEVIAKMSPGLHLGTPSLMFFTKDLDAFRSDLVKKEITVGEVVDLPSGRVFNFADDEENYFAVMEKKN